MGVESFRRGMGVVALLAGLGVATGCQIGPGRLKVAASHYSDAVRIANGESLLMNLVRLRFRDEATFLAVTNISTQFELENSVDVNGSAVTGGGAGLVGAGGGIRYSERPTISFSILGGESFQRRMLMPLAIPAIALLAESGWRVDRVLRLTAEGLNGLHNAPTASGPTPSAAPEYLDFLEATRLLRKLRLEGLIEFQYESQRDPLSAPLASIDGGHSVGAVKAGVEFEVLDDGRFQLFKEKRTLVMRFRRDASGSPDAIRLRDLLRLDPGRRRYPVVQMEDSQYDPFDPDKRLRELAVDSRSLMGVLYYLSNGVGVGDDHLERKVVTTTLDADGNPFDWQSLLDGLFTVHMRDGSRRPADAALAVRHRGRWFYVDDGDQDTKSTFLFLAQLFTLQAGDVEEAKPVLTLPVGR